MNIIQRGKFSEFINPSKFESDTESIAIQAIREGDALRNKIKGRRILQDLVTNPLKYLQ